MVCPPAPFYSKCCRAALSRSCSSCQCSCRQDGVSTYRAGRERKRLRRHQPAPAKIAATMNSTHASDMPLPSGEFLTITRTGHLEDQISSKKTPGIDRCMSASVITGAGTPERPVAPQQSSPHSYHCLWRIPRSQIPPLFGHRLINQRTTARTLEGSPRENSDMYHPSRDLARPAVCRSACPTIPRSWFHGCASVFRARYTWRPRSQTSMPG
jgi:hypothetical protein